LFRKSPTMYAIAWSSRCEKASTRTGSAALAFSRCLPLHHARERCIAIGACKSLCSGTSSVSVPLPRLAVGQSRSGTTTTRNRANARRAWSRIAAVLHPQVNPLGVGKAPPDSPRGPSGRAGRYVSQEKEHRIGRKSGSTFGSDALKRPPHRGAPLRSRRRGKPRRPRPPGAAASLQEPGASIWFAGPSLSRSLAHRNALRQNHRFRMNRLWKAAAGANNSAQAVTVTIK
jgi:hypothetical protein